MKLKNDQNQQSKKESHFETNNECDNQENDVGKNKQNQEWDDLSIEQKINKIKCIGNHLILRCHALSLDFMSWERNI